MVDLVTPGETDAAIDSRSAGAAWANAANSWIVNGVDIAGHYSSIDDGALDGFRHATTSGLTVTIAAGEAYVAGWLVRDQTTDVALPDDQTTRVYVGYDAGAILAADQAPSASENVIVGTEVAFDDGDPKTPIYDFTASGGEITDTADHRQLQEPVAFDPITDSVAVNAGGLTVGGTPIATETYVDDTRYTDGEAQSAVTDVELPGSMLWIPNVDGHPDGLRVGPDGYAGLSALAGDTVLYSLASGGEWRLRNHFEAGDMFTVSNAEGNAWLRGHLSTEGVIDNSAGEGIVPAIIEPGESLPSDTLAGRIVYDVSREE